VRSRSPSERVTVKLTVYSSREKTSSPLSAEQITVETSIDSDTVTTTSIKTTQSQTITATESDAPKTFPVPNGADGHEIKKHYSFNPRNFMTYFALEQIKANNIFPDCAIHSCFFHFSQAIWHNCKYPKSLWNYNDIINGPEYMKNNFYFTNNLCEDINKIK
jgi:hypothetical protein